MNLLAYCSFRFQSAQDDQLLFSLCLSHWINVGEIFSLHLKAIM